jgi:hypothetical protein
VREADRTWNQLTNWLGFAFLGIAIVGNIAMGFVFWRRG